MLKKILVSFLVGIFLPAFVFAWTCEQCKLENNDSKKFCTQCGWKHLIPIFCKSCGEKISEDELFCGNCGLKIEKIDTATKKDSSIKKQMPQLTNEVPTNSNQTQEVKISEPKTFKEKEKKIENSVIGIQKGDFLISAQTSIAFLNENVEYKIYNRKYETKYKTTAILLSGTKLITDCFGVGGLVSFKNQSTAGSKSTTTIFGIDGVFYFMPKNSITPYISLEIGKMDIKSGGDKVGGICYGGSLGLAYFINKNFGLNFGTGYITASLDDDMDYTATAFSLGLLLKI